MNNEMIKRVLLIMAVIAFVDRVEPVRKIVRGA